jgi:hypothetical protein
VPSSLLPVSFQQAGIGSHPDPTIQGRCREDVLNRRLRGQDPGKSASSIAVHLETSRRKSGFPATPTPFNISPITTTEIPTHGQGSTSIAPLARVPARCEIGQRVGAVCRSSFPRATLASRSRHGKLRFCCGCTIRRLNLLRSNGVCAR